MCFELRLCAGLCVVLGTGLHFVFNWLGRPRWLAPLLAAAPAMLMIIFVERQKIKLLDMLSGIVKFLLFPLGVHFI